MTELLCTLLGLSVGCFIGEYMKDWDWRMSADSHHQSQKSRGRWFRVMPMEYKPDSYCHVCQRPVTDGYSMEASGESPL